MRILILDDSHSYGTLLASACKKLGHTSVVTTTPAEALSRLGQDTFDVVLVDLEMPEMDGTMFVSIARDQGVTLPMGICTGSCMSEALAAKARALGELLPKIWTHADLRSTLRALQLEGRAKAMSAEQLSGPTMDHFEDTSPERPLGDDAFAEDTFNDLAPPGALQPLARGTGSTRQESLLDPTSNPSFPETNKPTLSVKTERRKTTTSQVRRAAPRIHVRCSEWEHVRKLCMDVIAGQTVITVRAQGNLRMEQTVILALALPDEMVVSIEAVVVALGAAGPDGKQPYQIELNGFGDDEINFLLERCDEFVETAPASTSPRMPRARSQVPLPPSTPADAAPKIPDSVDSVDIPIEDPYAPKISWD